MRALGKHPFLERPVLQILSKAGPGVWPEGRRPRAQPWGGHDLVSNRENGRKEQHDGLAQLIVSARKLAWHSHDGCISHGSILIASSSQSQLSLTYSCHRSACRKPPQPADSSLLCCHRPAPPVSTRQTLLSTAHTYIDFQIPQEVCIVPSSSVRH